MVVHRRAGGLDDEYILGANVVFDFDLDLTVAEGGHLRAAHRHLQVFTDSFRKGLVGVA